jgi:serine protease Do
VVRLQHPKIRALAQEYVLLRIGNMRGVDLSLFDFDYDLPWYAFFLGPEGNVLGRFGGRDAEAPGKYQTLAGLNHSMAEALKRHRTPDSMPRAEKAPKFAEDYPAAKKRPSNACIHCHHVHEFRRDLLQREERWSLDDVWLYPQPENVGLTLDTEQGNRVSAVQGKSAAAMLGIEANALLVRMGDVAIASVADVQYALQKAPKSGALKVEWRAGRQLKSGALTLNEGWRKTDVSWRWSLKSMSPNPSIIGDDLDLDARKKLGLDPHQLAYRHMNFLTPTARHAGLLPNDVIVGLDDKALNMTARQFETHIRLHHRVGQEVVLNVMRGNDRIKLKLKLPD